jgi:hypothetical protein
MKHPDIEKIINRGEISLLEILYFFLSYIRVMAVVGLIFAVFGIIVSSTNHKYYTSVSKIIPENAAKIQSSPGLENLQDLVAGGSGEASFEGSFGPESFAFIANSQPFLLELMKKELYFNTYGKKMSLFDFFLIHDERNLSSKIFGFIYGLPIKFFYWVSSIGQDSSSSGSTVEPEADTLYRLTSEELSVMTLLSNRIHIENEGYIKIEVDMPEPEVSAAFNEIVLQELIEFVTEAQTRKQRQNLQFIQNKVDTARRNFENAQVKLAQFRDANQGLMLAKMRTQEERLVTDYNLYFNIYNSLAIQLETSKIELQEKTPMFTIFEPVYVPLQASGGFSVGTVIRFAMIGVLLSILWIAGTVGLKIFIILKQRIKSLEIDK